MTVGPRLENRTPIANFVELLAIAVSAGTML